MAVTPSDTLIRRSISQQKTGVSITIDDPVRTARQPSPPRGKVSSIVHVSNLVRERCSDSNSYRSKKEKEYLQLLWPPVRPFSCAESLLLSACDWLCR